MDHARRSKELEQENGKLKRLVANLSLDKQVLEDLARGKFLSPERRRRAVNHARKEHGIRERHTCRLVNQPRGTQRLLPIRRQDEDRLAAAIIQLAS